MALNPLIRTIYNKHQLKQFINLTFKKASDARSNNLYRHLTTTKHSKIKLFLSKNRQNLCVTKRHVCVSHVFNGSAARAETTATTQGLSQLQAEELVLRLSSEERLVLFSALQDYQSKLVKDEYLGQLAVSKWRSHFGRPSKLPGLGDVDPTGTYCVMPEDWLTKKYEASVPRPTTQNLIDIGVANSIPFVGFGFLDNFFMLLAGDYIDMYLGSYLCLTTMGAAALGNTISDVLGIGTAFYVERFANRIGYVPPKLSPMQMEMPCSRNAANLGRVLGVTIGCFLGMFPLMFKKFSRKPEGESGEKTKVEEAPLTPANVLVVTAV